MQACPTRSFLFALASFFLQGRPLPRTLSVSRPEADNSVAAQLASFQLAEGYEINLFADESMGIANPVCFRWDAEGQVVGPLHVGLSPVEAR